MPLIRTSSLLAVSCLLAGCNSTDRLYPQGPWNQPGLRRSYPNYSQPWGYHPDVAKAGELQQVDPLYVAASSEAGVVTRVETRITRRVGALPDDPVTFPPLPVQTEPPAPALQDHAVASSTPPSPPPVPTAESPPGVFSAPKQARSYAGTWSARDGQGASCTIHLSSVASLDLYKASASKCANEHLRSVNTWSFAEDRVVLFSRGKEVARLSGTEASLDGTIRASGRPLKMTR